jgi:hypothetical protein
MPPIKSNIPPQDLKEWNRRHRVWVTGKWIQDSKRGHYYRFYNQFTVRIEMDVKGQLQYRIMHPSREDVVKGGFDSELFAMSEAFGIIEPAPSQ